VFDIGASELLLIVIVAIVVIGPKDLPLALRTAGRWIGKIRRISSHFRSGVETMIREAEMEEMEQKWREQNEAIMAAHPHAASAEAALIGTDPGTGEAPGRTAALDGTAAQTASPGAGDGPPAPAKAP
jgi:sec-independent protein translocase protein TatB